MRAFELDLRELCAPIPLQPATAKGMGGIAGLSAWISLKQAGDMGESAHRNNPNRIRFLASLGVGAQRPVFSCRQVHSRTVVVVDRQEPQAVAGVEADGLITDRLDVVLSVTVADCLPIVLADGEHGAFALLHSGWRGTGIVSAALKHMQLRYGSRSSRISATIGPGIGSCCYRVEEDRYREFRRQFGAGAVRRRGGGFFLDLVAANAELMRGLGMEEVLVCSNCTVCTTQLASFRRDGARFRHMLACVGVFDSD